MNKFIILLGQRVRSGTNFVGTTLAQHPDLVTIPRKMSLGEFNLFYDDAILTQVYNKITEKSFGMHFKPENEIQFLKNYGDAWRKSIIEKYAIEEGKVIFIKSPYITNIKLWSFAFPDSKIAVICRDGRDNVISSVKASNDKRSGHSFTTRLIKNLNYYSGRSFVNHSKQWSETARNISAIIDTDNIKLFKYEELVGSKENISSLLKFYELNSNDAIIDKCINAPVVGSSFGNVLDGDEKPKWKPDYDKTKYQFSKKWIQWNAIKKMVFKFTSGKELINLGFEKDNKW